MASTTTSGPRYAPEDPTLPKPWRGLIDDNTGYLYFWNPETNVTQYERPSALPPPLLPPGNPPPTSIKLASVSLSSSIHVQHSDDMNRDSSDHGQHYASGHSTGPTVNDSYSHQQYNSRNDGGGQGSQPKLASIPSSRSQQVTRDIGGHTQNHAISHGNGASGTHVHGSNTLSSSSSQIDRSLGGTHAPGSGTGLSADAYRRQHEITIMGDNVPAPFTTFDCSDFPPEILKQVHSAGFTSPTPIQAQTWPIALQSCDVVAIAKTGSGKTLGYLVPGFIHIKRSRNNPRMGPTVLVLSPTRELATQILDEAVKFGSSSRISCACLYGGAPKGPQLRDIDRGVDIVVATPGRLNDILEMKRISLRQVSYLVLDEADRMLDMGFEPQIRKIVNEVPARRQTLMYTATWPKEVRKIAADLLINPVQVNIGNIDELVANKSITQYVEVVVPVEKQRRLEQILRSQEPGAKMIVFCSTKKMCDQLARTIPRQFNAAAIHGDKSQGERDFVLNQFRTGRAPVLVATDVAARGLDVKDIRVVINYDFPTGVEDYVHRIGRTGRAGATGISYTFFSDQDAKYAGELVKVLEGANQKVPKELRDISVRSRGLPKGRNRWDYGSGRSGGSGSYGFDSSRNDASGNVGRGGSSSYGFISSRNDASGNGGRGGRGPATSDRTARGYGRDYDKDDRGRGNAESRFNSWRRSRSRSRSPNREKGWEWGFSYGQSPKRSQSKGRSRSKSRSRSNERFVAHQHECSPAILRDVPPADQIVGSSYHSPPQQKWGSYEDEDDVWKPSSPAANTEEKQSTDPVIKNGGGAN